MVSAPERVVFDGVSKVYDRSRSGPGWRAAIPGLAEAHRRPHAALDQVDLVVRAGDAIGIIGPNGAGKSTALKLAAGVAEVTAGSVRTVGTIASMIELGVGLHPDLTGRENLRTVLTLQNHGNRDLRSAETEILEFSGLGDAIDRQVKRYSSGMRARLAFAASTHTPTDIMVVDEVLAVGDQDFQDRCLRRIAERVGDGAALLFVSHDTSLVSFLCSRVIQLRSGRIVDDGVASEVIERYLGESSASLHFERDELFRLQRVEAPAEVQSWERVALTAEVEVARPVTEPGIGVDLTLPTFAPDYVIASSSDTLPMLGTPGRYRLEGLSGPIPSDSAEFRMAVSLVDGDRQRRSDVAQVDVRVKGGRAGGQPGLNIEPDWSIHPLGGAETSPVLPTRPPLAPRHEQEIVVATDGLTKRYRVSGSLAADSLRSAQDALSSRWRTSGATATALDNVSLTVRRGESVGIIGPNGAGKSTLLKILAGLVEPDYGSIVCHGQVAALFDASAAFHPLLSGEENARVLARLLGLTAAEIDAVWSNIVEFAGLGDAMDAPVRQYSSGMRSRLWFAVATQVQASLLLIDELLAVGDAKFRLAAIDHVNARLDAGAAVLFVSHEMQLVEQICDRVVWIRQGRIVADGNASDVIDAYGGPVGSSGTADATGGIRVQQLDMDQRFVRVGGTLTFGGVLIVETPSDTAQLEIAYRRVPDEDANPVEHDDRHAASAYIRTVVPMGQELSRSGRYRFDCQIDRNQFAGEIHLVVSVIDGERIESEVWQRVTVGRARPEGFPSIDLGFDWQVTRIDATGGS